MLPHRAPFRIKSGFFRSKNETPKRSSLVSRPNKDFIFFVPRRKGLLIFPIARSTYSSFKMSAGFVDAARTTLPPIVTALAAKSNRIDAKNGQIRKGT